MKKQQQTLWLALGLLVAGVASQARAQEVNEREYRVVVEEAEGAKTEHRSVKIKVEEENDGYRVTGTRELEDGQTTSFDKFYTEKGAWREDVEFQDFSGFDADHFGHLSNLHAQELELRMLEREAQGQLQEILVIEREARGEQEVLQLKALEEAHVAELVLREKELHAHLQELEGVEHAKVNIEIDQEGDGWRVKGTRTLPDGEETTFSEYYEEEGAWRKDEAFQEFSGAQLMEIRIKDLEDAQQELEHQVIVIHEQAKLLEAEAQRLEDEAQKVKIYITQEGKTESNVFVEVLTDGLEGEVEVIEFAAETVIFENQDGLHFVFRTGDEEEEIVLTDDIIEKADLQNGKPFGVDAFTVFPNPSNGSFAVELSNEISEPLQVRVINLQGQEVYNETFDKNSGILQAQINLEGQESGIYLLQAVQGERVSTRKLVIE